MKKKGLFLLTSLLLIIIVIGFGLPRTVVAKTEEKNKRYSGIKAQIDYQNEIVTFDNAEAKKVYYSVAKKQTVPEKIKSWDDVKASAAEIDISTVIGTKEVYLYYKDGVNGKVKELKIAAPPKVRVDKSFYGININEGTFVLTDKTGMVTQSAIVQVKKGKRGEWSDWYYNRIVSAAGIDMLSNSSFGTDHESQLKKWQKSGATLYLRTAPTSYSPASDEVTVKIRKLADGPKLTLDPVKLVAKIKGGTEYRVNKEDEADNSYWTKVAKEDREIIKNGVSLEQLAQAGNTTTSAALTIEYRTSATNKKAASKVTTTVISGQSAAPAAGTDFIVEIKDLGTRAKPATGAAIISKNDNLEYMVIKKGSTADLSKGWKALKNGKQAKLKPGSGKTQVAEGDTILLRIKGQKENAKKNILFTWASAPAVFTVPSLK